MTAREVLAYAITHAPKGVKGGPYEGPGSIGGEVSSLRQAERWDSVPAIAFMQVRAVVPHARVIRIVRKARPSPCPVHDYAEHGREAEELRQGIAKAIADTDAPDEGYSTRDACEAYERLERAIEDVLDKVDARDSLAYLERKDSPSEASDEQAKVDRREWERAEALLAASPSHRVILGPGLRQMSYCADAIADLLEAMPAEQMPKAEPGEVARTKAALLRGMDLAKAAKARPSEASAVEVLREARDVLALCTTGRHVRTAPEYAIVKRIGSEMGYGALMSAATAAWAEMFDGTPQAGAQHTSGPAECTVQRTLAAIDRVLAGELEVGAAKESAAFETETWREASAVEVLRELVRWDDAPSEGQLEPTIHRARRVLAASGPDPSEVVRAAMAELEAWDAYLAAPATRSRAETEALDKASKKRFAAVDAYRKAGGK